MTQEKFRTEQALHLKYQNIFNQWAELALLEKKLKLDKSSPKNDDEIVNKSNDILGITPNLIPQPPFFSKFIIFNKKKALLNLYKKKNYDFILIF